MKKLRVVGGWWLVERLWTASILMRKVDNLAKYRLRRFYDSMRPGTRREHES